MKKEIPEMNAELIRRYIRRLVIVRHDGNRRKAAKALFQKQLGSMDAATFMGMTPAGWRDYDARQFCSRVFMHELRRLFALNVLRDESYLVTDCSSKLAIVV